MFEQTCLVSRRAGMIAIVAGLLIYNSAVQAKDAGSSSATAIGRIDFEGAQLPPANVEVDLSQGMFGDLFGIGDAAVAGIAEALSKSSTGDHAEATRLAAEKLTAVRQVIELAGKVQDSLVLFEKSGKPNRGPQQTVLTQQFIRFLFKFLDGFPHGCQRIKVLNGIL